MGISFDDMTLDELSEIYRVEKKSRGLSTVRQDLFIAMAKLDKNLRNEYEEELRTNPDSIHAEGANQRRKKCKQLSRDIIDMRMHKIAQLALRAAMGGQNNIDALTLEEREYYEGILSYSKAHVLVLDRLSGSVRYGSPDITKVVTPKPKPAPAEIIPVPQAEEPVEEYYEPEDEIPAPVEETAQAVVVDEVPVEEIPAEIPLDVVPENGVFDLDEEPEMDIPDDELDMIIPEEPSGTAPAMKNEEFTTIRMLQDVEKFAGVNVTYELKAKQVVHLPKMFADALISNNWAVMIKTLP